MSKDAIQITEPIARLFQVKNFAFVSTLMKDGSPQITPTWVDIEKNNEYSILVNTAEGRIYNNLSLYFESAISIVMEKIYTKWSLSCKEQ